MLSKLHVAIEGAVAVGKSTLLPKLHEVFLAEIPSIKMDLVPEPVDRWVEWKGTNPDDSSWNLLELMYQHPEENAARCFQMAAAISKIQSLTTNYPHQPHESPVPQTVVPSSIRQSDPKVFPYPFLTSQSGLSAREKAGG